MFLHKECFPFQLGTNEQSFLGPICPCIFHLNMLEQLSNELLREVVYSFLSQGAFMIELVCFQINVKHTTTQVKLGMILEIGHP